MLRIGIVAGEASGDQLGAAVIRALRAAVPDVSIIAMAGPRMRAAGCEAIAQSEALSVMGLAEILRHYPRLRRLRRRLTTQFMTIPLDAFLGIDVPDFTLWMERRLREVGVPTVHLVCPQVWAWRPGHIPTLRAAMDRLLTLFPFETDFLARHGIEARFVGHPLADELAPVNDREEARRALGVQGKGPWLALMPGSRRQEYRRHLPLFAAAAAKLAMHHPGLQVLLGAATEEAADYARSLDWGTRPEQWLHVARSREVLAAADVALCVSGTITLEAALLGTPLVVAYRTSWLTHALLRRMVMVRHIALPNLLDEGMSVPELLQDAADPAALADALQAWLAQPSRVARYRARCTALHDALRHDAGVAAAREILALVAARAGGERRS